MVIIKQNGNAGNLLEPEGKAYHTEKTITKIEVDKEEKFLLSESASQAKSDSLLKPEGNLGIKINETVKVNEQQNTAKKITPKSIENTLVNPKSDKKIVSIANDGMKVLQTVENMDEKEEVPLQCEQNLQRKSMNKFGEKVCIIFNHT